MEGGGGVMEGGRGLVEGGGVLGGASRAQRRAEVLSTAPGARGLGERNTTNV